MTTMSRSAGSDRHRPKRLEDRWCLEPVEGQAGGSGTPPSRNAGGERDDLQWPCGTGPRPAPRWAARGVRFHRRLAPLRRRRPAGGSIAANSSARGRSGIQLRAVCSADAATFLRVRPPFGTQRPCTAEGRQGHAGAWASYPPGWVVVGRTASRSRQAGSESKAGAPAPLRGQRGDRPFSRRRLQKVADPGDAEPRRRRAAICSRVAARVSQAATTRSLRSSSSFILVSA